MISNSQIRARARQTLGGKIFGEKWLFGLLLCLLASLILSAVPFASILLTGPICVGLTGVFLKSVRTGEKVRIEEMFNGFKDFACNFLLGFMIGLFTFLWSLLFIIPGIVKGLSYSMAYYIKNDHPEYDWKTCIEESKKMTKGYKGQLFCLSFSFIGWIIVGALCCGIGTLWVTPYQYAAMAEFYNQLKAKDEPVFEPEAPTGEVKTPVEEIEAPTEETAQ